MRTVVSFTDPATRSVERGNLVEYSNLKIEPLNP